MNLSIKRAASITSCLSILAVTTPIGALAEIYSAICEGEKDCTITVSPQGISGPNGFIPAGGVIQWYQGGEGDTHKAGESLAGGVTGAVAGTILGSIATCWTIILCPIGFIGGMAAGGIGGSQAGKSSEHIFTVLGYTEQGEKIGHSFYFVNKKPARRVAMELPVFTGLARGQLRKLNEISQNLNITIEQNKEQPPVFRAGQMPAKIGEAAMADKPIKKCWSTYLEGNPSMKVWVEANPELAEKSKKKFDDC